MAAEDKKKKVQKSYFDVLGLCCSSEVPLIEGVLKRLDGVVEISVIVPSRTVIVVHDPLLISQLQIVKALNQAGLEANARVYGESKFKKKWPSPYAIGCGVLLALSLLKYVYHPLRWLALGAVALGIFPMARKGLTSAWNLRLDANILMLLAVIGTIAMRDYLEAGTIVFLFTIAEWLETRASHKATAVMSSLMSIAPQNAVLADTGEEVRADEVKVDNVVAVKAGETIPIDGLIVEGRCEVDEKTLTGESFPVSKQKDSTVWAGTINLNGYIHVKATALAEDCVVAKMAKLVEEAQNNKSKTQRIIDRCAKYYTPVVVLISACLAVCPLALKLDNREHWFHLALVVLVSACPCALILSTPVATFCALSKAATSGLLVKGGDHLETLAKIKTMAFDKTGTITRGEFLVSDFRSLHPDISLSTLLYWVSSIESKSSHPMAEALVEYGRSLSMEPKPENVEEFHNFPGEGIHGKIDGKDIYIGNKKIGLRAGCETDPASEGEGKTIGYIYSGTILAGVFNLSDSCRTGVLEAMKALKKMGIKTVMLTGDSGAAAMHAQEQVGNAIDVVHSELLPEDKAEIITQLKKEGAVGMVGDGVNDAPALATADIGISMGVSGSALATETGNVILMSNDMRKIPKVVQIARKTRRKVIENILVSISTKAAIIALAVAGHPLVWAAVLADVGTCLLVIFNSMLLLRGRTHVNNSSHKHAHTHTHKQPNNSSHTHSHCCSDVTQVVADKDDHHHAATSCCSGDRVPCVNHCCSDSEAPECSSYVQGSCADNDEIHEVDQCCSLPAMPTSTDQVPNHSDEEINGHCCESEVEHHHIDIQPSQSKSQHSNCHDHHHDIQPPQPKPQNSNCHTHKHHDHDHDHNHNHDHDHDHQHNHHHNHHHYQDKSSPFEIILPTMGSTGCCRRRYFKECCGHQGHGHLFRGGLSEIITE